MISGLDCAQTAHPSSEIWHLEITAGKIVEYRIHRHQQANAKRGKPPAHRTMDQEIATLRQTLKTATRHGWLDRLPDFSEPYRLS
jgi:hypothetical protein